MVKLERDVLEMTRYIHQLLDDVLREAIECMEGILLRETPSKIESRGMNSEKRLDPLPLGNVTHSKKYAFPLGVHTPLDTSDSIVSQGSKNKPFGGHSDTKPKKQCNYDDEQRWSHSSMM